MIPAIKRVAKKLPFSSVARRAIHRLRSRRIHQKTVNLRDNLLGSDYGGWSVDQLLLDQHSVVYSFGVGEDISFDLELINLVGCVVHAFDPTPVSVQWLKKQSLPKQFQFHEVGLAAQDGTLKFQMPSVSGWASYSRAADPAAVQRGTVDCPVMRLATIMSRFAHPHIDLLKMDVEGFEYEVLEDMIQCGIRPKILLVEFHHGHYGIQKESTIDFVKRLRAYGYEIYWVSDVGLEYGFVSSESLPTMKS